MLRDPFYRQIEQALEDLSDDQRFERCMGDLLRLDYPWIVPVSGGTDSGMDGAIADGEGEPIPLACTIDADVIGNLTRSLDSYVKRGLPRRKVVLATSHKLTASRRHNLADRAREKGFDLLQIFDREPIADRLMSSPRWCNELLGLAWKPSPLASVPPTRRPLIDFEPVGREEDLAWLEGASEDRVLSGEPGSGKTFLFLHLIRKRNWPGLFLAEPSLDGFRDAWLEQRPQFVVVDDAHVNPDLLSRLVRLREEMKAPFHVIATTWEGGRAAVMEALGVPATRVRKLELLTRKEILQVIQLVGVRASNEVLRDLVSQAANKPGLAVTIASLWQQGSYEEVLDGSALARTLTNFFSRILGSEAVDVLACLAFGGDRGMNVELVGRSLQLSPPRIREIVSGLAWAGVISEADRNTLAVWPRKLRFALIRSVFFPEGPGRLEYQSLLDVVPSPEKAVETLVAAKGHGAGIPDSELRALVTSHGSREAWKVLAGISRDNALWVMDNYPEDLADVAWGALHQAEEETILRLLRRAGTERKESDSRPLPAMRLLEIWVKEVSPSQEEMIRRRKVLARVAKSYLRFGDRSIGLHGICLALQPSIEDTTPDPADGWKVTVSSGLLSLEELGEVKSIWPEVRNEFSTLEVEDWKNLSAMLWNWVHPSFAARQQVDDETEEFTQSFAAEILKDIAPAVQGKPGLTAKVQELAEPIEVDLDLLPDPVFELLFPSTDGFLENREQREAEWETALDELATRWSSKNPDEVAELLAYYEREAQGIGRAWPPRGDSEVCRRMAALVEAPQAWLEALLTRDVSGVLTGPFLESVVEKQREGWELQVQRFLELDPRHAWSAVESVLRLPSPPAGLLASALAWLDKLPQLLTGLCMRRQVPLGTLKTLLRDPRLEIALTAAVGEWNANRQGGVRPEVAADWHSAILKAKTEDFSDERLNPSLQHWLGVILAKDPSLAFDWLAVRLKDPERPSYLSRRGPSAHAIAALRQDQRLRLVEELEKGRAPTGFVGLLVGKDTQVYAKVLASEPLRSHHLEPLGFLPDDDWIELTLLALKAGHEPNKLARASLSPKGQSPVQWGSDSENWQRYQEAFALLEQDPRYEVQEIARHGQRLAAELCEQAKIRERQMSMHGFSS